MGDTKIEWTDYSFNPWHGCQRVSPGCENCYAETFNKFRHGGSGPHWGPQAPRRFFGDAHWNEPLKWNRDAEAAGMRQRVFCASMADVFEDREDLVEPRNRLWRLIHETPHLDWQLLTKRPQNIREMLPGRTSAPDWYAGWPNVWLGTTVEDQKRADERIPHLMRVPAAVRFLSMEPLLEGVDLRNMLRRGPLTLDALTPGIGRVERGFMTEFDPNASIGWVIVGGESGAGARPMRLEWARSIVEQCKAAGVACFVKQLGAAPEVEGNEIALRPPRSGARGLAASALATHPVKLKSKKGGDMEEWPADLRVREFPAPPPEEQRSESP